MKRRAGKNSTLAIASMACGLVIAVCGLVFIDDLDEMIGAVHIGIFPGASAAEGEKGQKKDVDAAREKAAKEKARREEKKTNIKSWTDKDLSFLNKLSERKAELDLREKELEDVEKELQKQKKALDKKISELKKIRSEISRILKDRIEIDDEKISKLVEFYSNMKPQQAAQVFAEINEDLAVEVLGRMKKKNAAAIMNLLKADKAQVLSEKFAGYRRPAANEEE